VCQLAVAERGGHGRQKTLTGAAHVVAVVAVRDVWARSRQNGVGLTIALDAHLYWDSRRC
jgi:hypothetical protein